MEMGAYHHLFLTDQSTHGTEKVMPLSALRDGSAVLRLERGTRIEGTVVSPDGRPVSGAEVFYGRHDNSIPPVKTDDRGTFALGIKPGVASSLTARHAGFGPAMQAIRVGREPQKITLTLHDAQHSHRSGRRPRGEAHRPRDHPGQFLAQIGDARARAEDRRGWAVRLERGPGR